MLIISLLLALQAVPVETLRIGVASGPEEYEFFDIAGIDVSSSREIFVANAGTSQIRVYGSDGVYRRSIGRDGDGPGEFRRISSIRVSDSEVIVQDRDEIEVFTHGGEHLRTVRYPRALDGELLGVGPSVWLFRRSELGCIEADRACPRSVYVETVNPLDGSRQQILGPLPGRRFILIGPERSGSTMIPGFFGSPLFESAAQIAVDGQGEIFVSQLGSYAIQVYSEAGSLLRRIEHSHEPVGVSDELLISVSACLRNRGLTDQSIERRLAGHGEVLPAVTGLLVSADGTMWVQRGDVSDESAHDTCYSEGTSSTWDRFDSLGSYVTTTVLPANFSPLRITAAGVFGILTDERGVEFVLTEALEELVKCNGTLT